MSIFLIRNLLIIFLTRNSVFGDRNDPFLFVDSPNPSSESQIAASPTSRIYNLGEGQKTVSEATVFSIATFFHK